MQIRTRAIVLHSLDFSDSSLICTVFCEQGGRTSVLAKGAKQPKSKFFGRFVPGNRLQLIYSFKSGRQVQTATDAELSGRAPSLWENPDRGAFIYNTLELCGQLVQDHLDDVAKFDFLWNLLVWASDDQHKAGMIYFPYVQLRLCALQGIGMVMENAGHFLNVESGEFSDFQEGGFCYALSDWQKAYLSFIRSRKTAQLIELSPEKKELHGLIHMFDIYMRHHIESLKPRRSAEIFDQMEY